MLTLRPFDSARPHDAEQVADVLLDSIRGLGPTAYTPAQVEAWAAYPGNDPEDLESFRLKLSGGTTLVAEVGGRMVAFGQIEPSDHIEFLYCRSDVARRGIASGLYRALESVARAAGEKHIHTEASRVSLPFFESHGYRLDEVEHVERCGEVLERFRMSKLLSSQE